MTAEVIVIDDDDEPSYEAPLKKMRFSDNSQPVHYVHAQSEGLPHYGNDFDYMSFFGESSPETPTFEEPHNPDIVEIIVIDEDEANNDETQLGDTMANSILIKQKSQIQKSKRTYECSICMDDMNHD